jgi:hypothetical protein
MNKDKKAENKYQRGKIYKIISNQSNDVYIGSTCEVRLCNRLSKHKSDYKQYLKGNKNNITSYNIVKYPDCEIILLEHCPCNCKEDLLKRERHYIETFECVNKVIPGRKKKESDKHYRDTNKNKRIQYIQENRAYLKEKQKEYRQRNCEKIKLNNLHFRQLNRSKNYCDCGGTYSTYHKSRHLKSIMHGKHLEIEANKAILEVMKEQLLNENIKSVRRGLENQIVNLQGEIIHLSSQLYKP